MFINQEFTYEFAYRQTTTFLACFAYSSVYAELKKCKCSLQLIHLFGFCFIHHFQHIHSN